MPQVGIEPTIPVFRWAKTVHALDRAATMVRFKLYYNTLLSSSSQFTAEILEEYKT
jgi:hypothetical protein